MIAGFSLLDAAACKGFQPNKLRSSGRAPASMSVTITAGLRLWTTARIRPMPNTSSELHLKVEIICFRLEAISVSYARVAFAFPWLDGTPLVYDWDFSPSNSFGSDFWSDVESAVDDAVRAYVRANFDVGM